MWSRHAANGALVYLPPDASIKNIHVAGDAAVAYSKLSLAGSIVNADVAAAAAVLLSKLAIDVCHARTTAAKNVPQSTDTRVDLAAEDYDTNAMHDNVTNNSRVTVKRAGKYLVKAHIVYDVTLATGNVIYTFLFKNGTEIKRVAKGPTATAAANDIVVLEVLDLVANDYLEVFAHSSNQDISASSATLTVIEQAA